MDNFYKFKIDRDSNKTLIRSRLYHSLIFVRCIIIDDKLQDNFHKIQIQSKKNK